MATYRPRGGRSPSPSSDASTSGSTVDERFDRVDERFGRMDEQIDGLVQRVDRVEGRIKGIDVRLATVEEDTGAMQGQVTRLENAMRRGFRNTDRQFEEFRRYIIRDELRDPPRPRKPITEQLTAGRWWPAPTPPG